VKLRLKLSLKVIMHVNDSANQKIYNGQENRVGRYQQENLPKIGNVSSITIGNIITTNTTSNIIIIPF
jgi:hypothetical protein